MDDNVNSDVNSDGSDIEIDDTDENDTLNDDFELKQVDRNADEWLMALFDSDTENEDEFEGFQEEWQRWVCSTSEATLSFDWRCYISTARGSRSIPLL